MPQATRRCSIDRCNRPVKARGWCNGHYGRWRDHGDPLAGGRGRVRCNGATLAERLWSKIERVDSGCWHWVGGQNEDGYGLFTSDGTSQCAHRAVYELLVAAIPAHLQLDHLCRNPQCVNPSHLEPVTPQENVRRGWTARRS